MNTNHNNDHQNRDENGDHQKNATNRTHPEHEAIAHLNENQSGDNIPKENRESRHHHQEHGNRKYEAFRNHSSADDQPMTNTDTTP